MEGPGVAIAADAGAETPIGRVRLIADRQQLQIRVADPRHLLRSRHTAQIMKFAYQISTFLDALYYCSIIRKNWLMFMRHLECIIIRQREGGGILLYKYKDYI